MKDMKVCVFSDSHAYTGNMIAAAELEKPDVIFGLGDGERDLAELADRFSNLPVYAVRGNCDFRGADMKSSLCVELGGVTIYATHGHLSRVKYEADLETLTSQAVEAGAQVALYGHTHMQHVAYNRGVLLLNPGSAGRGYYPSYAVLSIENGIAYPFLNII